MLKLVWVCIWLAVGLLLSLVGAAIGFTAGWVWHTLLGRSKKNIKHQTTNTLEYERDCKD